MDMQDEARRSAEQARATSTSTRSLTGEEWGQRYQPAYTVQSGDNLSKIARENNTTVEALLEVNPSITNPNQLSVSQAITLPTSDVSVVRPANSGIMSAPNAELTPSTSEGLMAPVTSIRPKARPHISAPTEFIDFFVEKMGNVEGTEDHNAPEGQFTYAYGILPKTAQGLGIDPDDYPDRKTFAKEVYKRMNDSAIEKYPAVFEGLTESQQAGILSLYINLGNIPKSVVDSLSGTNKDFNAAGESLSRVIHYTSKTRLNKDGTGIKYASKGLSARRAGEYNTLMASIEGFVPVDRVSVTGTRTAPVFNWLDSEGNVIKSFASNHTLSPDNDMVTIEVR